MIQGKKSLFSPGSLGEETIRPINSTMKSGDRNTVSFTFEENNDNSHSNLQTPIFQTLCWILFLYSHFIFLQPGK